MAQLLPLQLLMYFIVLLNPFSQTIILWDVMKEQGFKEFGATYLRATLLSYGIYLFFAFLGDLLVSHVFQIRLASLKIFGGLVILMVSFRYLMAGAESNLLFRGKIGDLASEISLPFMVGPATIWVSILIGRSEHPYFGMVGVGVILMVNWGLIALFSRFIHSLKKQRETMVGKYFAILMRTNSLFIGAIGVEMIVGAITTWVASGGHSISPQ